MKTNYIQLYWKQTIYIQQIKEVNVLQVNSNVNLKKKKKRLLLSFDLKSMLESYSGFRWARCKPSDPPSSWDWSFGGWKCEELWREGSIIMSSEQSWQGCWERWEQGGTVGFSYNHDWVPPATFLFSSSRQAPLGQGRQHPHCPCCRQVSLIPFPASQCEQRDLHMGPVVCPGLCRFLSTGTLRMLRVPRCRMHPSGVEITCSCYQSPPPGWEPGQRSCKCRWWGGGYFILALSIHHGGLQSSSVYKEPKISLQRCREYIS